MVGSYRPITLLNADCTIIAKAIALRLANLEEVIDATQTAFLPCRWIADNVLSHLEEVDFLDACKDPGCIVFLDYAKAYDRLDRAWVLKCMRALGFGPQAVRCVHLLQHSTHCAVLFNGWRSHLFPVRSGLPQGSPLSPILYVIAAQPLASLLRLQASMGLFHCIRMPDGTSAPPCHQHADDTSLHVRSRADARVALDGPVALYCAASNSLLNRAKSLGLLFGAEATFEGVDENIGVPFSSHGGQVKHLGIYIGHDADACNVRMFDRLIAGLRMRVGHWSAKRLSFLGRAHVAKQVLGASLWYHATFVRPSPEQLQRITDIIMAFVAGGTNSAGRPRALFPGRAVSSLDWSQGGVRLVNVEAMISALQAKLVARLLSPPILPWQKFFASWLHRSVDVRAAHAHLPVRLVDQLGYGLRLLFCSMKLSDIGMPKRQLGYLHAFQSLQPHRVQAHDQMTCGAILHEPVCFSPKVVNSRGSPISGLAASTLASAGITTVGELLLPLCTGATQPLRTTITNAMACLPTTWRRSIGAVQQTWRQSVEAVLPSLQPGDWFGHPTEHACVIHCSVDGAPLVHAYSVGLHGMLSPLDHVPWLPLTEAREPVTVVLVGHDSPSLVLLTHNPIPFQPDMWALGKRPLPDYVVREACERKVLLTAVQQHALCPGQPLRPQIWEDDWDSPQIPALGLRACEARWGAPPTLRPPLGQRLGSYQAPMPAWQRRSRPRPLPPRGVVGTTPRRPRTLLGVDADADALCPPIPQPACPWAGVWRRLVDIELDRGQRVLAWRILHGSVLCGALRAHIGNADDAGVACPHPACMGCMQTLSHTFVACPVAVAVWGWVGEVWTRLTGASRPPVHPCCFAC